MKKNILLLFLILIGFHPSNQEDKWVLIFTPIKSQEFGTEIDEELFEECNGQFSYEILTAVGEQEYYEEGCFDIIGPSLENGAEAYLESQGMPSSLPTNPSDDFWSMIIDHMAPGAMEMVEYENCMASAQIEFNTMMDIAEESFEICMDY